MFTISTNKPRFSITVSDEIYEEINTYQHAHRLSTQTKAIAELISLGIESLSNKPKSLPVQISDPDLSRLHSVFDLLDDRDRGERIGYANGLLMQEKYKKKARSQEQAV